MIKLIFENASGSYKDYWAYKEVSKRWESDIDYFTDENTGEPGAYVAIWYNKKDNDLYAQFRIEKDADGLWVYDETDGDMLINDSIELDSDNGTIDDAIKSCFYYFHTRY